MMMTTALFFLKKMPRIFILLFLFISIFILSFLLLGCSNSSSTYSSSYIIKYSFNKESSIYPLIAKSYKSKNITGYEDMIVRAGYMNLCFEIEDEDMTCTSRNSIDQFANLTNVNIYTTNSNSSSTSLDLVSLAADFSDDIVHPYVLIATIILSIALFISVSYIVVPGLPGKPYVNKFNLVLSPILALLWGLGAMWAHVAADAGHKLVESASMDIINAHVGRKASAMTWTPFTFLLMIAMGIFALHLRDLHNIIDVVEPKV